MPLLRITAPDCPSVREDPDETDTCPDDPFATPLENNKAPDCAPQDPEYRETEPLFPERVVPELIINAPDAPTETAFADRKYTEPELELAPAPDTIVTDPPTLNVEPVAPA